MKRLILVVLLSSAFSSLAVVPASKVIPFGECSKSTGAKYPDGRYARVCAVTGEDVRQHNVHTHCKRVESLLTRYAQAGKPIPEHLTNEAEVCITAQ